MEEVLKDPCCQEMALKPIDDPIGFCKNHWKSFHWNEKSWWLHFGDSGKILLLMLRTLFCGLGPTPSTTWHFDQDSLDQNLATLPKRTWKHSDTG